MDKGPSSHKRNTRRRRVSSPSAANTGAESSGGAKAAELWRLSKVVPEHRHNYCPAFVVGTEGLRAAGQRNAVESGLGHREQNSVGGVLQDEFHQCSGLAGVIDRRVGGVGMPTEGK